MQLKGRFLQQNAHLRVLAHEQVLAREARE